MFESLEAQETFVSTLKLRKIAAVSSYSFEAQGRSLGTTNTACAILTQKSIQLELGELCRNPALAGRAKEVFSENKSTQLQL